MNIDQTVAEIRRRDDMYPTEELTAGAVADRRTLLNIVDTLQDALKESRERANELSDQLRDRDIERLASGPGYGYPNRPIAPWETQ